MTLSYSGGTLGNTSSNGLFYVEIGGNDVGLTHGGGQLNHTFEIRERIFDQYAAPLGFEVRREACEFTCSLSEVTLANLLTILPGASELDGGGTVGAAGARGTQLTEYDVGIYIINEVPCGKIKMPAATVVLNGPIELGEDVEDIVYPVLFRATLDTTQASGRQLVEYTTASSSSDLIIASASPAEGASVTSASMPVVLTFNKVVGKYWRDNILYHTREFEGLASTPGVFTAAWGSDYKTVTLTPAASYTAAATQFMIVDGIRDTESKWLSGDGSTAHTAYTLRFIG